jgi:hypothetical protein
MAGDGAKGKPNAAAIAIADAKRNGLLKYVTLARALKHQG